MATAGGPSNGRDMNFSRLVERMVPLVAELFATLASRDPLRMYFADIAEKTLHDIVSELGKAGLSQEAIAASLGMTIGGFRNKMRRLREAYREEGDGTTESPRSLMEHVYGFIHEHGSEIDPVEYRAIEEHFSGVKEDSLRGVLHFLVQYGLLSVSGRSATREYRIVPRRTSDQSGHQDAVVALYRDGPLSAEDLGHRLELSPDEVAAVLQALRVDGRLGEIQGDDGVTRYRATAYHIPVDAVDGFEAALWDHFQAMCRAICRKVRLARYGAAPDDRIGGATYSYDLPADHPLVEEIGGFLRTSREKLEAWRVAAHPLLADLAPGDGQVRLTIYIGQTVEEAGDE